jgi:hypothetical protein
MQNEPEKMIEIEEDFYDYLIQRDIWLECLEQAGVDNWEGLSAAYEALDKFYEDLENEDEEGEN